MKPTTKYRTTPGRNCPTDADWARLGEQLDREDAVRAAKLAARKA
jgi:hypothetical protein